MAEPPRQPNDQPPPSPATAGDRRVLPRRFYSTVSIVEADGTWHLELDSKPAKTPGKKPLAVANAAIAERLAAEWRAQATHIDPATMPITTLVCTAIDAVALQPEAVAAEIVKYAGSDLLCYRAEAPQELVAAEAAAWDPILDWAARDLGAVFALSNGFAHVAQSDMAIRQIAQAVGNRPPLSLAALHVLTTLMGSAVLALAVDRQRLTIAEAWRAAHVDEDWQIAKWGEDAEAARRRAVRLRDAEAAATVLALLKA